MEKDKALEWRVNTPGLLNEILINEGTSILVKPLQIFSNILAEVGERASKIDDLELNKLMLRLAIYEMGDPNHPNYSEEKYIEYMRKEE